MTVGLQDAFACLVGSTILGNDEAASSNNTIWIQPYEAVLVRFEDLTVLRPCPAFW